MTNSGFITNWFKPLRGAQQGCPVLPYLFILSAELLSNKIRQDPNLKGLNEGIDLKGARSRFAHLKKILNCITSFSKMLLLTCYSFEIDRICRSYLTTLP